MWRWFKRNILYWMLLAPSAVVLLAFDCVKAVMIAIIAAFDVLEMLLERLEYWLCDIGHDAFYNNPYRDTVRQTWMRAWHRRW